MKAEEVQTQKIDLDTILKDEIGQFGKYQARTWILVAVLTIFMGWGTNEYIFTTARINSRCLIPECDDVQPEWAPYWLSNAVPVTSQGTFDDCQRFANTSSVRLVDSYTCPSTLFDRNTLTDCESYVYEETYSIVYEFDLACEEWTRSLIGTIRNLGTFIGLPIVGFMSDRWGRRVALCITAFNSAWLGIVRYWANTYIGFTISAFVESLLGAGCFTTAYILLLELVGPKYRVMAGASLNSFFAIGSALTALVAWAVPYWRHLTLALYIPQLLMVTYYWLMPESLRWNMSKGRFEESEAILKKVAEVNGRELSDKSLKLLRQNAEDARIKALVQDTTNKEWLIVTVFKHKRVLLRCMVAPVWWITTTFIYYGLSVNAVNMTGNKYLNFVAVSLIEVPGFWMGVILMRIIGRKTVLTTAFWLCAACQIAYIFIPEGWYALSLSVYLVAKFSIAMEVVIVYIYTAELYPTVKRQSLFNFTSMVGRIGSMVAPLTPAFFDLACEEWTRSLIGTIRNLGTFIGLPIVGFMSDRWGRRVALCITAFNSAWLGIVRYWANTYIGFTISAFVESLLGAGCFTTAYILLLELVGPKYRVMAGASLNSFFAIGSALTALVAWAVPYWRHLTLALYIPQLLMVTYYWLMPESLRWNMSKGRFEESEAILKKVAEVNGRELSDKSLKLLRQNAEDARIKALVQDTTNKEWLIVTVFKHKRVLLRCMVAPVWWITTTFIYYGLSVNAVNMTGNKYLNFVAVSLIEVPGFWMGVILMRIIGRKTVLTTAFWLCAACQIAYIFIPEGWYALSLSVYLVAKFSIAMEVVIVYIYTAELYPTVKRQSLFNFTSMVGRIGSMVAPLTPAFGAQWFEELPFVLFASFGVLSGALVFLTPETLGTKLPDNFEQAEALGRKEET